MTALPRPFHVVYTNRDYAEEAVALPDARAAALRLLERIGVAIRPRDGIGDDAWQRMAEAYEAGPWKGASIFRIEAIDPERELQPIDPPYFTAQDLDAASVSVPLAGNPPGKAVIVLMNIDYLETAQAYPDRASAARGLIGHFGLTREDVGDGDFPAAFAAAYEAGSWRGCLVAEVDLVTLEMVILDPDALPYDPDDLPAAPGGPRMGG